MGVIVRANHERAAELGREILEWCGSKNRPVLVDDESARSLAANLSGVTLEDLVHRADPIVSLGGDGTLLGVARYVTGRSPVFIGVNFGNLGFLTEIAPEEVFGVIDEVLGGRALCGERVLVTAEVVRGGSVVFASQAVNDVVVQKEARSRLPEFDLAVDGEDVARIRADGLILSTPTGSTAYSMSAGGSICHPALSAFLITPICPHSLTHRPLIIPASSAITVEYPATDSFVLVTVDGQLSFPLESGDLVRVKQTQQTVKFVRSRQKGYFDILRTKLNWGAPNRAE